ncbi:MAG: hypothetical protein IIZ67_01455 [Bacilli bacterium]|nr:hypothetical protein [Bacilli bacterium]
MKSSYKLLGVFWDKLSTPDIFFYMDDSIFINELDEEYNLFDTGLRKINLSTILKVKNEDELITLIKKIDNFESLLINVDYIPINKNKILMNFYIKRIKQIYGYFKNQLNSKQVFLSSNVKKLLD